MTGLGDAQPFLPSSCSPLAAVSASPRSSASSAAWAASGSSPRWGSMRVPLCQAAALLPAGISWPPSASPQILDEVEKRRQISMAVIYPFMQGLRESPFPAPGKTVTIKSFIPESGTEVGLGDSAPSVLLQHGAASMAVGRAVRTLCPGGQRCCFPWVRAVVRMRMEPTCGQCHFAAPSAWSQSPQCKTSPGTIPEHHCSNSLSVSTAVLGLCWFTPLPQGCNPAVQAAACPLHRLS